MKRAALFVGVNTYRDPEINDLECAERDATELFAFFKHRAGYDDVRHLLGPEGDEVLDTARAMRAGLSSGDLFLVFFAGHGVVHGGEHLLLFSKAKHSRIKHKQHAVPVPLLVEEMDGLGLHRILIIDTCRNDLLAGSRGSSEGMRDVQCLKDAIPSQQVESGSSTIICSCDEGQQSREIKDCGQGVFALALLQSLQEYFSGAAFLTASGIIRDAIPRKMKALADQHGFTLHQRPWIQESGQCPPILNESHPGTVLPHQAPVEVALPRDKEPERQCGRCGAGLQPGWKACPACGLSLVAASEDLPPRLICPDCRKRATARDGMLCPIHEAYVHNKCARWKPGPFGFLGFDAPYCSICGSRLRDV